MSMFTVYLFNGTLNATADFNQDQDRSEMIVVVGGY